MDMALRWSRAVLGWGLLKDGRTMDSLLLGLLLEVAEEVVISS